MSRRIASIFLFLLLLLIHSGCVGGGSGGGETISLTPEQIDTLFQESNKAYFAAETDDERLPISMKFLAQCPESKYTGLVLRAVVNVIGNKRGDYDGAIVYALEIRAKISDPEILLTVDKQLLDLYGNGKRTDRFRELAARLDRQGNLKFSDYMNMLDHAVSLEAWDLVPVFYKSAEKMANAKTYKTDNSDLDYTDEEFEVAGRNRMALLLTYYGRAGANLGQVEEALAAFARADGMIRKTYLGYPDNELYLYWGKTLLEEGDAQGALGKLVPAALFCAQKDALDPLKQAYLAVGGNESGFEEFVWDQRLRLAKTVDDFTLDDYDGQPRRFADLRGKVTLLGFWNPT
jgi:tetratricopeptide (TPR) repeat protein